MIEVWEKAKENREVLYFKNFQRPEITWDEVLQYVYKESTKENELIKKEAKDSGTGYVGNIITWSGYFYIRDNNLFHFKGVKEFLEKVNGGDSGESCSYYTLIPGTFTPQHCNCKNIWHTQALRFNITQHFVVDHYDPNDVLYWQILGNSTWQINKDKKYLLEPGDVLYFNKEDSHAVFQDGPRCGIIIDNLSEPGRRIDISITNVNHI